MGGEVYLPLKNVYRKPPNISPGLIFVRKHILMGLYTGWGLYTGGGRGLIHGPHFGLAKTIIISNTSNDIFNKW